MLPVPEKASAASALRTTFNFGSCLPACFHLKWKKPMTAPLKDLLNWSGQGVAKNADLR